MELCQEGMEIAIDSSVTRKRPLETSPPMEKKVMKKVEEVEEEFREKRIRKRGTGKIHIPGRSKKRKRNRENEKC